MPKLEVFLWVTINMRRRNILLVTKLAQGRICNTTLTGVYIIALYLFFCFFNFHKLLLSTNEVLYLQKQPLLGTLQKQLLLILTNILQFYDHCRKLCFLWTTSVVLLEYVFGGKGGFNHFQALNTSTKFKSSFDFSWSLMLSKSLACRIINAYGIYGKYVERKLFSLAIYLKILNVSVRKTVLKNQSLQLPEL